MTHADLVRVADRLLASRPSFVAYGDLDAIKQLPYKSIEEAFAKRDASLIRAKKSFLFRSS